MTARHPISPALAEAATQGSWASVAVVLLLALLVVGGALGVVRLVTRVFDHIRDPAERLTTYECGEDPVGTAWFRFNNRFTTVALTFLIFDVELALLWPILPRCLRWLGQGDGWLVFSEIAVFAGTLALGLMWVAQKGGFVWDRSVETSGGSIVDRGGRHD
ncbi:MAG: NADH-quinone oxidoreductase subunit A [Planctomycetota bacterium]|nr:NADH-quinone oxidoreductase subunit A [Planctomycetota bacterium]